MSLVTVAEIKELMETGLSNAALQGVIDREEDWLATDPVVGIGPLEGERTDTARPTDRWGDLLLQRAPDPETLEVVDNGVTLSSEQAPLVGAATIRRVGDGYVRAPWVGPLVEITFTPTDTAAVKRAVIELVRITVTGSPYRQEATEGHSYSREVSVEEARDRIARSLSPHRSAMTMRLGQA